MSDDPIQADRFESVVQRYRAGEITLEGLRAELGLPDGHFIVGRTLPDGTREVIVRTDRPWRR